MTRLLLLAGSLPAALILLEIFVPDGHLHTGLYFWTAALLFLWVLVRLPAERLRPPKWARAGADLAAVCAAVSAAALLIGGWLQLSALHTAVETVLPAAGEEAIFRFAPFALLAHAAATVRWALTAGIGVVLFTALHLPDFDAFLLDKLLFAVAALALLQLTRNLLWPVLLHIASNLLWQLTGPAGGLFVAADLALMAAAVATALLLTRKRAVPVKEALAP